MTSLDPAQTDRRWRLVIAIAMGVILIAVALSYANKVGKGRSAFMRWRPQVQALVQGEDIYARHTYPNLPLVALGLYPFSLLPPMAGAMLLFLVKVVLAAVACGWAIGTAVGRRGPPPAWAIGVILLLSLRPIISDLQHGNINIIVLFLVIAACRAFARDRPLLAGIVIGLATVVKVTPGLFIPYFAYKRQWRAVAGCGLGVALGVLAPTPFLGWSRNVDLHRAWYHQMIAPYLEESNTEFTEHINQSLTGVFHRWFTQTKGVRFTDEDTVALNVVDLAPETATTVVRVLMVGVLVWLALVCRTPVRRRDDWRLACEFGLIVIGMLILSERTWKHHFVTIVLPIACLVVYPLLEDPPRGLRRAVTWSLIAFGVLTLGTSGELIGWVHRGVAHKYVEAAGSFFLAAAALAAALSAVLVHERGSRPPRADTGRRLPTTAHPPDSDSRSRSYDPLPRMAFP